MQWLLALRRAEASRRAVVAAGALVLTQYEFGDGQEREGVACVWCFLV